MKRRIIQIDEEKCTGCGACAAACHEGAIAMVDGKARLMRDDYCDGLGDCLPACPADAITFVEREAAAYDEAAVAAAKAARTSATGASAETPAFGGWSVAPSGAVGGFGGCPGSQVRTFDRPGAEPVAPAPAVPAQNAPAVAEGAPQSELAQWPCQIKLVPPSAPFFDGAKLLVAADCTAFARADFHKRFIKGTTCVIGCPKLDAIDYSEKLAQIVANNDVKSVHVVRMEVPCCGGIENAVKAALQKSGKMIPWRVTVIGLDGSIVEE